MFSAQMLNIDSEESIKHAHTSSHPSMIPQLQFRTLELAHKKFQAEANVFYKLP